MSLNFFTVTNFGWLKLRIWFDIGWRTVFLLCLLTRVWAELFVFSFFDSLIYFIIASFSGEFNRF